MGITSPPRGHLDNSWPPNDAVQRPAQRVRCVHALNCNPSWFGGAAFRSRCLSFLRSFANSLPESLLG